MTSNFLSRRSTPAPCPDVPATVSEAGRRPTGGRLTPRRHRALALPVIVGVAIGIAACSTSTPLRFHTLVAPVSEDRAITPSAAPFLIEVLPVGIPAQLDQPQLVIRDGVSGIAMPETERWAAPLADEIRDALSADLSRQLATRDIAGLGRPAATPVLRIKVQVRRLDAWLGQQVQLVADWSVETAGRPVSDVTDSTASTSATGTASAAAGSTSSTNPTSPTSSANPTSPSNSSAVGADPIPALRLACGARLRVAAPGGYPELVRAQQQAIAALAGQIATAARAGVTTTGRGAPATACPEPRPADQALDTPALR